MEVKPIERKIGYTGWDEHQQYISGEETIITYEHIPTTRKEKIKEKIDNLIGEIIHIFVILALPIILLWVYINDKRRKKS